MIQILLGSNVWVVVSRADGGALVFKFSFKIKAPEEDVLTGLHASWPAMTNAIVKMFPASLSSLSLSVQNEHWSEDYTV